MDRAFQTVVEKESTDYVSAKFQVTASHSPGTDRFQPSEIFSLAEKLIRNCGEQYTSSNLVDASAQFMNLKRHSAFGATANLLLDRSQYWVWDVQFSGEGGDSIAALKFSYLSVEAKNGTLETRKVKRGPKVSAVKSENRRSLIAEAACQVIADKGFAAASMREIAAAAGMHVPTMYQYVRSKDEVLELVYNDAITRVRENVADALVADLEPLDKLLEVVSSLIKGNLQMRKEAGVLNRELRSLSHEGRTRVLAHYAKFMDEVAGIISNGISIGCFRNFDPKVIANVIDAICDMWALRPFALSDVQEEQFIKEISSFITHGIVNKQ